MLLEAFLQDSQGDPGGGVTAETIEKSSGVTPPSLFYPFAAGSEKEVPIRGIDGLFLNSSARVPFISLLLFSYYIREILYTR